MEGGESKEEADHWKKNRIADHPLVFSLLQSSFVLLLFQPLTSSLVIATSHTYMLPRFLIAYITIQYELTFGAIGSNWRHLFRRRAIFQRSFVGKEESSLLIFFCPFFSHCQSSFGRALFDSLWGNLSIIGGVVEGLFDQFFRSPHFHEKKKLWPTCWDPFWPFFRIDFEGGDFFTHCNFVIVLDRFMFSHYFWFPYSLLELLANLESARHPLSRSFLTMQIWEDWFFVGFTIHFIV